MRLRQRSAVDIGVVCRARTIAGKKTAIHEVASSTRKTTVKEPFPKL
jgi:hypothetical protein